MRTLLPATLVAAFVLSTAPALALSEREGQDIYQGACIWKPLNIEKGPPPLVMPALPIC